MLNCKPNDMAVVVRTQGGGDHTIPDECMGLVVTVTTVETHKCGCGADIAAWNLKAPTSFICAGMFLGTDQRGRKVLYVPGDQLVINVLPDWALQPIRGQGEDKKTERDEPLKLAQARTTQWRKHNPFGTKETARA